ncbi:M20 family metallo-hydrolase [Microbacterium saperdae]
MSDPARPASDTTPAEVRTDADRLWRALAASSALGATDAGGLHRLALSESDARVRELVSATAEAAGWEESFDAIGNQFITRPGVDRHAPVVLLGSHLDTQPLGGRFDGVYGVLAALEVLHALDDRAARTRRSIVVVNWTNEEGARFSPSMMGSAVFTGALDLREALARQDVDGVTVADALADLGFGPRGAATWAPDASTGLIPVNVHAALEIHIEQGPTLEAEQQDIGFVTGVQAIRWYDITVSGRSGHAGTTPLDRRADALVAAAGIIEGIRRLGERIDPALRPTVGELIVTPNSRNVIPGGVRLGVDLRHPDETVLDAAQHEIELLARSAERTPGIAARVEPVLQQAAVTFDAGLLDLLRRLAAARGLSGRDLMSGAGHDAMQLAQLVPTAMLFIPCVDGISHNEAEDITEQWSAAGAALLFDAVAELAEAEHV